MLWLMVVAGRCFDTDTSCYLFFFFFFFFLAVYSFYRVAWEGGGL